MLRALTKYVFKYNPGMSDQLLQFDEEIQTKSLQYDCVFLRKWVARVIRGLNTKTYDLAHILPDIMFSLLAKSSATRNIVTMTAANKLEAGPYTADIKDKNACAFHNRLK